MTTDTVLQVGDRVYYNSPDSPGTIQILGGKKATIEVDDGRSVIVPVTKLKPLPDLPVSTDFKVGDWVQGLNPNGEYAKGRIQAIGNKWLRISGPGKAVAVEGAEKANTDPSTIAPVKPTSVEVVATEARDRLNQLETQIERSKAEIWAAAHAIREEKLWQLDGYESFEAYCKQRWGWKSTTAHENALAGEVMQSLNGIPVAELPRSTSAMNELNKVDPEQRTEVLQQAREANGGNPTAKAIRAVAKAGGDAESPEVQEQTASTSTQVTYSVGDLVVDKYRPYSPIVIAKLRETQACCWAFGAEYWIGYESLEPYRDATAISLEAIARRDIQRLAEVLGKDVVARLFEEVA